MKILTPKPFLLVGIYLLTCLVASGQSKKVDFWLTNLDKSALFRQQPGLPFQKLGKNTAIETPVVSNQYKKEVSGDRRLWVHTHRRQRPAFNGHEQKCPWQRC